MLKAEKKQNQLVQRRNSNESAFFVQHHQSIRSRSKNHLIEKTSQTTNLSVNLAPLTKVNSKTELPELVPHRREVDLKMN